MGTEITLDVAGISVTYSKTIGELTTDRFFRCNEIDYDWYKENGKKPNAYEMAFERTLKQIVPRLELVGFNIEQVRREYDVVAEHWQEERLSLLWHCYSQADVLR